MSCSRGKCGFGSNCMCGNCCGGCGMYMYHDIEKVTSTATIIDGVAPKTMYAEGPEKKRRAPATVDDEMDL